MSMRQQEGPEQLIARMSLGGVNLGGNPVGNPAVTYDGGIKEIQLGKEAYGEGEAIKCKVNYWCARYPAGTIWGWHSRVRWFLDGALVEDDSYIHYTQTQEDAWTDEKTIGVMTEHDLDGYVELWCGG